MYYLTFKFSRTLKSLFAQPKCSHLLYTKINVVGLFKIQILQIHQHKNSETTHFHLHFEFFKAWVVNGVRSLVLWKKYGICPPFLTSAPNHSRFGARTPDTQWRHKSKKSENLGRCGRQNMLRQYLKIWDWDLIFGHAVKAISSLGVRSPWQPSCNLSTALTHSF